MRRPARAAWSSPTSKTSRDRLAKVAGEIDGLAVTADVGQEADIKALIAAAEARFGPVDVFFSNAGLSRKDRRAPTMPTGTSAGGCTS